MIDPPRVPRGLEVLIGDDEIIVAFPIEGGKDAALTIAESEVVRDMLAGLSNAAIARSRGRSARTIANQVASILRKLGVRSRVELAARMAIVPSKK